MSRKLALATLVLFAGVALMLLVGPDSPQLVGGWSVQWFKGSCIVRESRVVTLTTSGYRAVFRVDVYDENGKLLSMPYGATAVAGDFGYGGYQDGRNENQTAYDHLVLYPPGNHTCHHSGAFVEYPASSSCKRCTELVYFDYDDEHLALSQKIYMALAVSGIVCLLSSFCFFVIHLCRIFIRRLH